MGLFSRKKKIPPLLADPEIRPLVERAMAELQAKQAAIDAVAKISQASWSVDQDVGTIEFRRKDGILVTAPVQIIGTFDTKTGTWLWAWDNPSINESLCRDASAVREYGQEHKIDALTTRKSPCQESDCWELTALACKICDAQAAYRGPAGTARVFMTFGTVQLSKSDD